MDIDKIWKIIVLCEAEPEKSYYHYKYFYYNKDFHYGDKALMLVIWQLFHVYETIMETFSLLES